MILHNAGEAAAEQHYTVRAPINSNAHAPHQALCEPYALKRGDMPQDLPQQKYCASLYKEEGSSTSF